MASEVTQHLFCHIPWLTKGASFDVVSESMNGRAVPNPRFFSGGSGTLQQRRKRRQLAGPGRIFKTTEAKAQVTFCLQAHPVPSQGKEKPTEQHLLIKSLFSSPCLFLTQGSANWCPHSADQRGKWGLLRRIAKRPALPECGGKLHYFWRSGPEHSGDSLPYFPLWIGDCPPAHSCLGHPSSQGASSGGNGASAFTSFEWAVFGWLSWYSDSYLRRRQVSHFLAAQGENFGNILNSFLPHVPLPVHQHIVLAPHSKVNPYL
ncbi:uncharacterized protein LOC111169339 isoform X2 [Delphinapterus leucas]|uniref:Uncharacterized protein LOC111169339 isoform X2 n=1 Tax=Delphinapterus leucas TaxID=9749 RepID=A0A2Y9MBU2_DELLE|nr:uncharacterized protein LOC111169339 isoform X2 [Delphinapterus leucas]XP_022419199.1 uncharacterized protein LOC111169339 isoform X2 [Delphinapterus leucas]XP_030615919.1 uncharacterized protein LOC111169339 isoform X2 [Delphinapterus leucas]